MELTSRVPQLREITYSYSPHSDIIAGVGDDELTWIEGEQELAFCTNVVWVNQSDQQVQEHQQQHQQQHRQQQLKGTLILSNFRLRFLPDDAKLRTLKPVNKLLSRFDVVLYNIESMYKIKRKKRKQLMHDCLLKEKVEKLEILCKSFQTVHYDLTATKEDDNLRIIYHLIRAAVEAQTDSLMVYAKHPDDEHVEESNFESYWSDVLDKCGEKSYRAVTCNESFHVTDSLPKTFVVPASLSPKDVVAMSTNFVNNRCPCWTYSCKSTGTALIRMSYKAPGVQSNVEEKVFDSIRSSHPYREYPKVFDLSSEMPTIGDIRSSYGLLQQLCVYDSTRQSSDSRWYNQLETTRWMEITSRCLKVSKEISTVLSRKGLSVVIKEYSSTDLSPLVASLVQIMLEEECRTTTGFRDLVKKEWLSQGHKFGARLQSRSFGMGNDSCPFFLLFLDCVFQLVCLRPESFEFNSSYLVMVWHSTCQGLFRDLLFNSPKDLFYTTMKVQLEFQNGGSCHLRRNQLSRSNYGRQDSGVVGTLLRKSHLDFTTLKRHMTSLTNLSQSQSMFSPSWNGYDSYSLKKSRSKLSRFSTLSINQKAQTSPLVPVNDSSRSSNASASQLQLATPTSNYGSDWSEFSSAELRKDASLSHQRLNVSQQLDQSDASYENPWTDVIGEISRSGSALLWDWSFLYEPERMFSFKSYEYVARLSAKSKEKEKKKFKVGENETPVRNGHGAIPDKPTRKFQKSALVIKGQTIYNYTSSFVREVSPLAPSDFLAVEYSVPRLTFWSSCHLRFHPAPSAISDRTSSSPPASPCSPSVSAPDSGIDEPDHSQLVFHRLSTEIMELEKCLCSLKVDSF